MTEKVAALISEGKPHAGNPHVCFYKWGESHRRQSQGVGLYSTKERIVRLLVRAAVVLTVVSGGTFANAAQKSVVNNPFAKEGMALSRIALSPVNIIGHAYAQVEHYGSVGVVLAPVLIAGAVPGGAFATCSDVITGLGEMLMLEQFLEVKYPWQSFDYENSEHWMKIALIIMGAMADAADDAQEIAGQIDSIKHKGKKENSHTHATETTHATTSSTAKSASGYGFISGPGTLRRGSTGTYKLRVGGKVVNADWSQGGTSISVYGSGDHARVMAGNPPVKSGTYKTSIRARYNGTTYSKTIYIQK